MNAEMYDALVAAGAPEDKARAAAVSMSEETVATRGDISNHDKRISQIQGDIKLVKWMLVLVIAATVLPLLKSLI